ncbi:MAG: ABC transporter permease [Tenericutes bacterium]|nr:ABC transporter permease [Mycoplasmatota bacterium]
MPKNIKSPQVKKKREISDKSLTFISALFAILAGLVMSFILLYILEATKAESNYALPVQVFNNFLTYAFKDIPSIIKVLYNAAPLILVGLSVGFAFKAGLFNIGATGQYTVAAFFSLVAVILWGFPWWAAILVAMVTGGLWGFVPGYFKAKFNINEVITTIMLNWVALYFTKLLLYNLPELRTLPPGNRTDPIGYHNPTGLLPDLGLKELTGSPFINIGIIIAIVVAIIIYIVMNKTTFGFEIKACGHNKDASIYAGIKAKRTIVLTMIISGALAGIAGAVSFLAGTIQFTTDSVLLPMGFNGIPVALLAFSNPLGIVVSGVFIGYLYVGGQAFEGVYSSEVTNIILSVIIYFSAFALIVSQMIRKKIINRDDDGGKGKGNIFKRIKEKTVSLFKKKEDVVENDEEEVTN